VGFWLVEVLPAPPLIQIYTHTLLNPLNALDHKWFLTSGAISCTTPISICTWYLIQSPDFKPTTLFKAQALNLAPFLKAQALNLTLLLKAQALNLVLLLKAHALNLAPLLKAQALNLAPYPKPRP